MVPEATSGGLIASADQPATVRTFVRMLQTCLTPIINAAPCINHA